MSNLISINEAAAQGIERLRLPKWANPFDHLLIAITDGRAKFWPHLYSPINLAVNGHDGVTYPAIDMGYTRLEREIYDEKLWEVYTGPLSTSEEYQAAEAKMTALFKR